jgi:hypothetical protein
LAGGVGDRQRGALRDAEQGEPVDAGGRDDGLQVRHPAVEAEGAVARVAVREPAAALVVADERVVLPRPSSQ